MRRTTSLVSVLVVALMPATVSAKPAAYSESAELQSRSEPAAETVAIAEALEDVAAKARPVSKITTSASASERAAATTTVSAAVPSADAGTAEARRIAVPAAAETAEAQQVSEVAGETPADEAEPARATAQSRVPDPTPAVEVPGSTPVTTNASRGGDYIVVLKPGIDAEAAAQDLAGPGNVKFVYDAAINGFAATLPQVSAAAADPRVLFVEPDGVMRAHHTTQVNPPSWGLDRIDQRNLPLDQSYTYHHDGTGVHVFIVDTGINKTHQDFTGRAHGMFFDVFGGDGSDCNGHGSHVAGTAGGAKYGVAKNVFLHPVRVLGCGGSGSFAGVIAGLNWILANGPRPAVANMSLGGGPSTAVDLAVTALVNAGIPVVVSAGNANTNACEPSPARANAAVTVASTMINDVRSGFSNWGPCVDIFAPGSNITSAWWTSNTATNTISGTSMSSPHVAGAIALAMGGGPKTQSFGGPIREVLINATQGVVIDPMGAPNLLLFVGPDSPPPTPAPIFTLSVSVAGGRAGIVAALNWSGFEGATVEILRNGTVIATAANDGQFADKITVPGTYTYQVCSPGLVDCSNEVTVTI